MQTDKLVRRDDMRITFNKACEIIYNFYGKDNVLQVYKPYDKSFYVIAFTDGKGTHLTREDLIRLI